MDQAKFVEESLSKILDDMVCLAEPYHLNFLGCLPQILLVPFLNTFLLPDTHMESEMLVFWNILRKH